MKGFALALAAAASLSAPVAAQTLSVLLPVLSFPASVVTRSAEGRESEARVPVCVLEV